MLEGKKNRQVRCQGRRFQHKYQNTASINIQNTYRKRQSIDGAGEEGGGLKKHFFLDKISEQSINLEKDALPYHYSKMKVQITKICQLSLIFQVG